jgi:predicted permease
MKRRDEQELDEELQSYLEIAVEEKMRRGLSREQATRAARVEFGSVEAVKDNVRDVGWEGNVERVWRDVRYAARTLRRSPVFSLVAIITLALGIGANTAIFSVVNVVMLRALPVERPHELIALATMYPNDSEAMFSYPAYRQFADVAATVAEAIAASRVRRDAITIDALPEVVDYKWVSGNYFEALGVPAFIGRSLQPVDDQSPPGVPVAVLSHAYWSSRFGRDQSVLGRTFRFKATTFTVVGVMPRGFFGDTGAEALDIWMPLTTQPGAPPSSWRGHSTTWLAILARLKPGVTITQARAVLEPIYDRVREEVYQGAEGADFRKRVRASRLSVSEASRGTSRVRDALSTPLVVLMALVGLVLLITCANVASLMLARAAARGRETAVCLAMGAGRLRVARHGLAEALILALLGGVGGLWIAYWGSAALGRAISGTLPISIDVSPDIRVLAFTLLVSCVTAIVCGLAPAIRASRIDPLPALKVGRGSTAGGARLRLRRTLVITQIAASLVLLVVAGLFVRSLVEIGRIDAGFDVDGVLLVQVAPPADAQPLSAEQTRQLYQQLVATAEAIPGVRAASVSFTGVLTGGKWQQAMTIDGVVPPDGVTLRSLVNSVSARYFTVMGIPVQRGRAFRDEDREGTAKVVMINRTFAARYFGDADPIGQHIGLCSSDPCRSNVPMMEVIGVTADAKYVALREQPRPILYVPFTQSQTNLHFLEVRTAGEPAAIAPALHRALSNVDPRLAIVGLTPMRDHVNSSLIAERLVAQLSVVFGVFALALAGIGLYGLIAYLTAQRTAEIGIRLALGADRRSVLMLVLRETLMLVSIAVVAGLPLAVIGARLLASQLYGVGPGDPLALSISLMALLTVAVIAGYAPASRASKVDPLIALRAE